MAVRGTGGAGAANVVTPWSGLVVKLGLGIGSCATAGGSEDVCRRWGGIAAGEIGDVEPGGRPCQAGKSPAGVRCSFPERQAGGTGVCVSADDWVYGESVFGESGFGDWVFVSGCW